jgi:hypothetical protein
VLQKHPNLHTFYALSHMVGPGLNFFWHYPGRYA